MSLFNAPRAPKASNTFDPPSARNSYEGFGGGAVGSVGGMNYGNTPWWMLPAGTQSATSFAPSSQMPAVTPGPAPAAAPANIPSTGGQQDFFSALAGLLGSAQRPGQAGPYARPQMMQMSPEIMARMGGQGMLPASNRMAAMPSAGARPYTGPVGISEKLRPTEKDPTPWTKNKSWQDPRENPAARGRKPRADMPATGGVMPPPGSQRPAPPGSPSGRRPRWGVDDFRAWAKAAPGGNFM